jgi:lipopolysaccharide biosynthesis regulator YciM
MAMDQLPEESDMSATKTRIMRNIGHAHLKSMQIQQAITAYEAVVRDNPADFECGLNLLVCYYALGDVSKLRSSFTTLLSACSTASEDGAIFSVGDDDDDEHHASKVRIRRDLLTYLLTFTYLLTYLLVLPCVLTLARCDEGGRRGRQRRRSGD